MRAYAQEPRSCGGGPGGATGCLAPRAASAALAGAGHAFSRVRVLRRQEGDGGGKEEDHCKKQLEDLTSLSIGASHHFFRDYLKEEPPLVKSVWCPKLRKGETHPPYCVVYYEDGRDTQVYLGDWPKSIMVALTGPKRMRPPRCFYDVVSCEGPKLERNRCEKGK